MEGNTATQENKGLMLLKAGRKGLLSIVFSRMAIILLLLALQVLVLFSSFRWLENFLPHIWGGTVLFSVVMVLYMLNSRLDASGKLTWMLVIMLMPVFGALLYLFTRSDLGHRALRDRVTKMVKETGGCIVSDPETQNKLKQQSPGAAALAHYLNRNGCCPVFENTAVTYFPLGEKKFEEMLRQLEKAERFIFLEYFIVDEGLMWGKILEILARKAASGVDVRVMYDGTCELSTLPRDYPKRLRKLGIQCKPFAPITPFVSTHYNYRDHRKILVIDGHTAFTGGVNLADEYINHIVKYGHWKDTAIMLQGEAARSFTLMFLQMWNLNEKNPDFSVASEIPVPHIPQAEGFVIPYGDFPVDEDRMGEQVYIDILNRAENYVHIMSPYLILDGETEAALVYAAKRGVDVRLILPGIPDKTFPYALAFTHYKTLLDAGVKIGEYAPGFVHAKVFVCDDKEAVVGTINLDYRSLYHHFECAAYLQGVPCISEIQEDFEVTWSKCTMISEETYRKGNFKRWLYGTVLKPIAPLM